MQEVVNFVEQGIGQLAAALLTHHSLRGLLAALGPQLLHQLLLR